MTQPIQENVQSIPIKEGSAIVQSDLADSAIVCKFLNLEL